MKKKILDNVVSVYLILFWFSGMAGIINILDFFFPNTSWLLATLIACLSGGAIYYATRPKVEWEEKWKVKNYEYQKLADAVYEAIDMKDATHLIPLCDPERVKYIKETSYFWRNDRIRAIYQDLKSRTPFSDAVVGKLNPYTQEQIYTEKDYSKYLWAYAKDLLDQSESDSNNTVR